MLQWFKTSFRLLIRPTVVISDWIYPFYCSYPVNLHALKNYKKTRDLVNCLESNNVSLNCNYKLWLISEHLKVSERLSRSPWKTIFQLTPQVIILNSWPCMSCKSFLHLTKRLQKCFDILRPFKKFLKVIIQKIINYWNWLQITPCLPKSE